MYERERSFLDCKVTKYSAHENGFVEGRNLTSKEHCLEIFLNDERFSACFCSPNDTEDLLVGLLAQAGKISSIEEVAEISVDAEISIARVRTTAGRCVTEPRLRRPKPIRFVAKELLDCADELLGKLSVTHAKTNGVHCGALSDGHELLLVREDVGRHNVFDKLYGWSLRQRVDLSDKILIFSGRCSAEMIFKLKRMNLPAVLAKSVPTTLAVSLAEEFGITLAARLSAGAFCIYTNPERIVLSQEG